jgi:hypothetical protein
VPLIGGSFNTVIGLIFLAIVLVSPGGLIGAWESGKARALQAAGRLSRDSESALT